MVAESSPRLPDFSVFPNILCQDLQAFLAMPTTTNICESTHRNYYRFLQVKNLPLVVAAFQGFKYCQQQIRDINAVATGLRPLSERDKSKLKSNGKKDAERARADEWDGGRAPTHTREHLLKPPPIKGRGEAAKSQPIRPSTGENPTARVSSLHISLLS